MQYLNFVSKKIFCSAVPIYGLLFLRGFWRLLINCLNSFFPLLLRIFSLQLSLHSSLRLTVQIYPGCEKPIISEYANKFRRKGIPSTCSSKYLA